MITDRSGHELHVDSRVGSLTRNIPGTVTSIANVIWVRHDGDPWSKAYPLDANGCAPDLFLLSTSPRAAVA